MILLPISILIVGVILALINTWGWMKVQPQLALVDDLPDPEDKTEEEEPIRIELRHNDTLYISWVDSIDEMILKTDSGAEIYINDNHINFDNIEFVNRVYENSRHVTVFQFKTSRADLKLHGLPNAEHNRLCNIIEQRNHIDKKLTTRQAATVAPEEGLKLEDEQKTSERSEDSED